MKRDPTHSPRIVKARWMPKKFCLNFFGVILTRDASWIDAAVQNHERIHTAQQHELLWIPFYLVYIIEWLVRLIQFRNLDRAYRNISFEREAYSHGRDFGYLSQRSHFSWLRHIFYSHIQLTDYERNFR